MVVEGRILVVERLPGMRLILVGDDAVAPLIDATK